MARKPVGFREKEFIFYKLQKHNFFFSGLKLIFCPKPCVHMRKWGKKGLILSAARSENNSPQRRSHEAKEPLEAALIRPVKDAQLKDGR